MTQNRGGLCLAFVMIFLGLMVSVLLADQQTDKVDVLFEEWDKPDSPGCALAVIRDGEIIYKKGYGMANLESDVPITPGSVFYIGSTSKQFVTMSIALLARDGRLSLDDDIRRHIPEMPDYGTPITIRNLIHHTSGIRDYLELVGIIAGLDERRMDEMIGLYHQRDSLELIARQRELNFKPGEKFLYSNSCYLLLAEIIMRVSGKTLREFAHQNIFEPLEMKNSHFHDDYSEPIKNRAWGYYPAGEGRFRLFLSTFDCVGSGGLFTSVEDLYLWDQNFYHHKVGGKEVVDRMHTQGRLNDGSEIDYAFALMIGDYKGLKTVRHGGALGGYRAELLRFPEQRFSVICLSNLAEFNPSRLCNQVADIYLAGLLKEEPAPEKTRPSVSVDPDVLKDYEGQFRLEMGITIKVAREGDGLFVQAEDQPRTELTPESANVFYSKEMDARLTFLRDESGKVNRVSLNLRGTDFEGERLADIVLRPERPGEYAGDYYSEELDVTYSLAGQEEKLFFTHKNGPKNPLTCLRQDEFSAGQFTINFERDPENKITAFRLSTGRVKNLLFLKR